MKTTDSKRISTVEAAMRCQWRDPPYSMSKDDRPLRKAEVERLRAAEAIGYYVERRKGRLRSERVVADL